MLQVESLDGIHNKYKAIQVENRKLYNMVQDLRGNIRVFCRVRPLGTTGDASTGCVDVGSEGDVGIVGGSKDGKSKVFSFDKVFGMGSTQEEVYAETQPLIRSVLDGKSLPGTYKQSLDCSLAYRYCCCQKLRPAHKCKIRLFPSQQ